MGSFRCDINDSGHVVIYDGSEEYLVVGRPTHAALMWAAWFAEALNMTGDGPPKWPITGLQSFPNESMVLFIFDGLPVGRIYWSHTSWCWHSLDRDGIAFNPEQIKADPEQSQAFILERQTIAMRDESVVAVLMAELDGRLGLFRDETRPMALMFGRSRARRRGVERRSTGSEIA